MERISEATSFPAPQMTDAGERAPRFALELPLRYRSVGERGWHKASVENISRSGVLFRTADHLDVDSRLEMRFLLVAGVVRSAVHCRGRVVRIALPDGRGSAPGVAATISRFRFVRAAPRSSS